MNLSGLSGGQYKPLSIIQVEKLHGAAFLGARLLCFDRGWGRGGHPPVHPSAGRGRAPAGATENV